MQKFDVIVVGGGMVGAAVALGLGLQGFNVAVIERNMPKPYDAAQSPDLRVSAINIESQKLLERLGAWQNICAMRACIYRRLSVWEEFGRTDFDAADLNYSHLGHIIENRVMQLALHQRIAQLNNITVVVGEIQSMCLVGQPKVVVQTIAAETTTLNGQWLVAADGANSNVRSQANIGCAGWQYSQHALAVSVKTTMAQQDITWQQFSATGPKAFLPLFDGYGSLVWYHDANQVRHLKSLSVEALKREIKGAFPDELGDFDILATASFPLTRLHAEQYYQDKIVLVGDAAHSINPLAGQGVNLGLQDVTCLLSLTNKGVDNDDIAAIFMQYQASRRPQNLLMMSGMDLLYKTFSNDVAPLKNVRNLVLAAANKVSPIKKQMMKFAMGVS